MSYNNTKKLVTIDKTDWKPNLVGKEIEITMKPINAVKDPVAHMSDLVALETRMNKKFDMLFKHLEVVDKKFDMLFKHLEVADKKFDMLFKHLNIKDTNQDYANK